MVNSFLGERLLTTHNINLGNLPLLFSNKNNYILYLNIFTQDYGLPLLVICSLISFVLVCVLYVIIESRAHNKKREEFVTKPIYKNPPLDEIFRKVDEKANVEAQFGNYSLHLPDYEHWEKKTMGPKRINRSVDYRLSEFTV